MNGWIAIAFSTVTAVVVVLMMLTDAGTRPLPSKGRQDKRGRQNEVC